MEVLIGGVLGAGLAWIIFDFFIEENYKNDNRRKSRLMQTNEFSIQLSSDQALLEVKKVLQTLKIRKQRYDKDKGELVVLTAISAISFGEIITINLKGLGTSTLIKMESTPAFLFASSDLGRNQKNLNTLEGLLRLGSQIDHKVQCAELPSKFNYLPIVIAGSGFMGPVILAWLHLPVNAISGACSGALFAGAVSFIFIFPEFLKPLAKQNSIKPVEKNNLRFSFKIALTWVITTSIIGFCLGTILINAEKTVVIQAYINLILIPLIGMVAGICTIKRSFPLWTTLGWVCVFRLIVSLPFLLLMISIPNRFTGYLNSFFIDTSMTFGLFMLGGAISMLFKKNIIECNLAEKI